ncbi:DUF3658 domain-containing protein [Microbulbifer sp. SSSA005]|uniref:DUF3658 domain-containing protein n=1 Tax=Microbulbifer sp. SSSA005 TaxID=3243378 RepID=UPI0040396456
MYRTEMSMEEIPFDPDLTPEQEELVGKLSDKEIEEIDHALISSAGKHYRKVAMVVAMAMSDLEQKIEGIPDVFYSQRVSTLVAQGKLMSQGNLKRMRFSEVKLP